MKIGALLRVRRNLLLGNCNANLCQIKRLVTGSVFFCQLIVIFDKSMTFYLVFILIHLFKSTLKFRLIGGAVKWIRLLNGC